MADNPTTVHVVIMGEQYEGGSVQSVHRTRDGARKAVKKLIESPSNDYRRRMGESWKWTETDDVDEWISGCDFIEIEPFEVAE